MEEPGNAVRWPLALWALILAFGDRRWTVGGSAGFGGDRKVPVHTLVYSECATLVHRDRYMNEGGEMNNRFHVYWNLGLVRKILEMGSL
jgi:hypothetical protein